MAAGGDPGRPDDAAKDSVRHGRGEVKERDGFWRQEGDCQNGRSGWRRDKGGVEEVTNRGGHSATGPDVSRGRWGVPPPPSPPSGRRAPRPDARMPQSDNVPIPAGQHAKARPIMVVTLRSVIGRRMYRELAVVGRWGSAGSYRPLVVN